MAIQPRSGGSRVRLDARIYVAGRHQVDRLLFLGSSCIYPRACPQPMREEHLLTGPLEPTNRAYAVAKIAGAELCRAFFKQHGSRFLTVMPTNLYGPGDNYDLQSSHVLPALIRKMHEARESAAQEVEIWGTGAPRREFLYSDDLAEACVFLMSLVDADFDALLTAEATTSAAVSWPSRCSQWLASQASSDSMRTTLMGPLASCWTFRASVRSAGRHAPLLSTE